MGKHTDSEGQAFIQLLENSIVPMDEALRNGDTAGVAKIMREIQPYINELIPHLTNASLQKTVQNIANKVVKLIENLEANGANISVFSDFIKSESEGLGRILKSIIKRVVNVMLKLLHL